MVVPEMTKFREAFFSSLIALGLNKDHYNMSSNSSRTEAGLMNRGRPPQLQYEDDISSRLSLTDSR
jgi:hypothetical protein